MLPEILLRFAITGLMVLLAFMMMRIQQHVIVYITSMMQTEIEQVETQNVIKLVYLKEIIMENLIITGLNF